MLTSLNFLGDEIRIVAKSGGSVTFDALVYSGGPLPGYTAKMRVPIIADLSAATLGNSLVANLDHDATQRVGSVNHVNNNGRQLRMSGLLNAATPFRDEVLNSHKDKFRWQASLEANVDSSYPLEEGHSAFINGRRVVGPVIVAAVTVKGFAFVSHGADDETSVSIAASRPYRPQPENHFHGDGLVQGMGRWLR